jgi:hypothetical protein
MKNFFVLFCVSASAAAEWMANVDEATRKEQSDKLMSDWRTWFASHESVIVDKGGPLGKTKRVSAGGVEDMKNDLNYRITVSAESHEAAADLFKDHPHLTIPNAYIEVMDASMPGM